MRSVECRLVNESEHELRLAHQELAWGSYDAEPPSVIPSGESGTWRSSTSGFMTGTEGLARFEVGSTGGVLEVYWNNPFIGENQFKQTCSGVPAYAAVEPSGTDPETGDPLDDAGLEGDDDVVVTYVLRTTSATSAETEEDREEHDTPPENEDPKPVTAPGSEPVLVRDADARFRKLVYFGVNKPQASDEAAALRNVSPALLPMIGRMPFVRTLDPGDFDQQWDAWNSAEQLDSWLMSMPLDAERRSLVHDLVLTLKAGDRDRPEMLAFIRVLAEVEGELTLIETLGDINPQGEAPPMKRLIISGHHRGYWKPGHGIIWGDAGYRCSIASPPNNQFTPASAGNDLSRLATVFPRAFAQVEDLCLEACNTGHHERSLAPQYKLIDLLLPIFPNLQTVWAHEATAPSRDGAINEILDWERVTRNPSAKSELLELARYRRFHKPNGQIRGVGKPIVWTREGDALAPQILSPHQQVA